MSRIHRAHGTHANPTHHRPAQARQTTRLEEFDTPAFERDRLSISRSATASTLSLARRPATTELSHGRPSRQVQPRSWFSSLFSFFGGGRIIGNNGANFRFW